MPTYVSLMKWTGQGIKDVKDTVDRAEKARQAVAAMGGSLTDISWTQGSYDVIAVSEFPDEETATAFLLTLARQGNLRGETLRAFSGEEMRRVVDKVS